MAVRLAIVLGFIAVCGGSLTIANRPPVGKIVQPAPSPYYICEGADLQYFPSGPEFSLKREAAKMRAYKHDLEAARTQHD